MSPGLRPAPSHGARRQGFAEKDYQAQGHEHQAERRRRRRVEPDLELGEYLGRECLEAQDREGPVLGQQVKRDQQAPAEQRQAGVVQSDRPERPQAPVPEASGHLFLSRVGAPETGCDRKVHERVQPQSQHQGRAHQTVERRQ